MDLLLVNKKPWGSLQSFLKNIFPPFSFTIHNRAQPSALNISSKSNIVMENRGRDA
jgi:hypothetical protein